MHFFFWVSVTLAHPPFLEYLRGLHVRVLSLVPNSILFIHGEVQGDHSVHWPMENIKKSFIQCINQSSDVVALRRKTCLAHIYLDFLLATAALITIKFDTTKAS